MKIQSIDIYWVKVPLACVWKTSYADEPEADPLKKWTAEHVSFHG
jgi:hypothetical protein